MSSKAPCKSKKVTDAPKGALVHAQTLLPKQVREEIEQFAKELDPHAPNFTAAFRRVACDWYASRKPAA